MEKKLIEKNGIFWPSKILKDKAWISDVKIYKKANKNPMAFWSKLAKEGITWFKPWKKTYVENPPYFRWFVGGKLNASYNCLDRHIETWRKNKAAIIWEPDLPDEKNRILTYYDLYREVNKFANVLKNLGVKKGDRVTIYLPLIPEAQIAMLACSRIGAIHSVVFSAFSSQALKTRILDAEAKVLVTADGYYRRGKLIDLKKKADEGIKGTSIEKVVVVRRAGNEVKMKKGRDYWWNDLMKETKAYCKPRIMDSEDVLFILYTSGCCHADSLVQLADGSIKRIAELVESKGSYLFNINLEELNEDKDLITGKYKYEWDLPLYKIKTPLTYGLFTPNHPFFVLTEDGEIIEKKAEELMKGEHILTVFKIDINGKKQKLPRPTFIYSRKRYGPNLPNKPFIPQLLTEGFAQLLGYFAGDGSLRKGVVEITDKDKRNLLFYQKLIKEELKLRSNIEKYNRQRLRINSECFANYLKDNFPEIFLESNKRSVPPIIQKSEKSTIAAFIRGFFDAEGSVSRRYVKVTSRSKLLIQIIQMLLLRFGILSTYSGEIRKTRFKDKKYEIVVHELKITDKKSLQLFRKKIGFSSIPKSEKLNKLLQRLKNEKIESSVDIIPIGGLLREVRRTIRLQKKESHAIFLDSYMYSKRRIRRRRLQILIHYLEGKIKLLEGLDLRKKAELKKAINLLKIRLDELARISGNSKHTVHQYLYSNKPRVSRKSISKLCKKIEPYVSKIRKSKLKTLRSFLQKLKKISKNNVGFVKITEIKKIKNNHKYVYDLTASKNQNYIVNGLVVHNTTGKPKGVIHTTGGYLTQAYWTAKWDFDLHDEDVFWCTSDIGWITGHTYACYGPLLNGATMLIHEGTPDYPKPDRWWEIIEKHGVTIFYTAPTVIRMLMRYGDEWVKKHDLSSLRILGTVGEPIDENTWFWYFKVVGKRRCPIIDTWWQTETGGTLINSLPGIGPFIPTFAGFPFPGVRAEIVDEEGKICKMNKEGNLVIKPPFPPAILRGIWKNPERYRKTYWEKYNLKYYFTEDRAYKNKMGMIRITGRAGDVMKVAGHRLSTAELENAIAMHPDIVECAVAPRKDEIKGQVPVAFITLKKGIKPSEKYKAIAVKQVEKYIGPIARPAEVYIVEDLPKTRSGKIMRRILRKILAKEKELGDLSTLANPESVEKIKRLIK